MSSSSSHCYTQQYIIELDDDVGDFIISVSDYMVYCHLSVTLVLLKAGSH